MDEFTHYIKQTFESLDPLLGKINKVLDFESINFMILTFDQPITQKQKPFLNSSAYQLYLFYSIKYFEIAIKSCLNQFGMLIKRLATTTKLFLYSNFKIELKFRFRQFI